MYRGYKNLVSLSTLSVDVNQTLLKEISEFSLYSSLIILSPFFLYFSQPLLGTVVNASLIGGALYLKGKKLVPLIVLPSLVTLSRGLLFGSLTLFLAYMLPFIWAGNAILIFSVKFFHLNLKKSYLFASMFGSGLKFAFIFSSALVLYILGIIPVAFLVTMGLIQLFTAVSASLILWPINTVRKKIRK